MGKKTKTLLKKQLQQTAAMFETQTDTELTISSLDAAAALMRSAVESMKEDDSEQFQNAYAGILRAQKQINDFCVLSQEKLEASHIQFLQEKKAESLQYFDMKTKYDEERAQVLSQVDQVRMECETEKVKADQAKEALDQVNQQLEQYRKDQEQYTQEKQNAKDTIVAIQQETETIQKDTKQMLATIQELEQQLKDYKNTRDDLQVYHQELNRIEQGLSENGYVDMESFRKALIEKKETGEQIISDYDRIIGKVFEDVEKLKDQIAVRNQTNKQE